MASSMEDSENGYNSDLEITDEVRDLYKRYTTHIDDWMAKTSRELDERRQSLKPYDYDMVKRLLRRSSRYDMHLKANITRAKELGFDRRPWWPNYVEESHDEYHAGLVLHELGGGSGTEGSRQPSESSSTELDLSTSPETNQDKAEAAASLEQNQAVQPESSKQAQKRAEQEEQEEDEGTTVPTPPAQIPAQPKKRKAQQRQTQEINEEQESEEEPTDIEPKKKKSKAEKMPANPKGPKLTAEKLVAATKADIELRKKRGEDLKKTLKRKRGDEPNIDLDEVIKVGQMVKMATRHMALPYYFGKRGCLRDSVAKQVLRHTKPDGSRYFPDQASAKGWYDFGHHNMTWENINEDYDSAVQTKTGKTRKRREGNFKRTRDSDTGKFVQTIADTKSLTERGVANLHALRQDLRTKIGELDGLFERLKVAHTEWREWRESFEGQLVSDIDESQTPRSQQSEAELDSE